MLTPVFPRLEEQPFHEAFPALFETNAFRTSQGCAVFRVSRPLRLPFSAALRRPFQGENVMRGRIIYVMGASGAGKDSLIREMRRRFRLFPLTVARRYITRPPVPGEEAHVSVSPEKFSQLADAGHFALQWSAHGCRYGISVRSERALAHGISIIINGSRTAFPQAALRYPDILPVLVTAPVHSLRQRLTQRGRESGNELEERLSGALVSALPAPGLSWIHIDNSGTLEDAADLRERELRLNLFPHAAYFSLRNKPLRH